MASQKPLITFLIEPELLTRLDDFRFGYRLASRGTAIRFLLTAALDSNPIPEPEVHPSELVTPQPKRRRRGQGPILPRATES